MCHMIKYQFCCDINTSNKALPLDELIRCQTCSKIMAEAGEDAKRKGSTAKKILDAHRKEAAKNAEIRIFHVQNIRAGGTCVPDPSDFKTHQNEDPPFFGVFYKRCDGKYGSDEGYLLPQRVSRRWTYRSKPPSLDRRG